MPRPKLPVENRATIIAFAKASPTSSVTELQNLALKSLGIRISRGSIHSIIKALPDRSGAKPGRPRVAKNRENFRIQNRLAPLIPVISKGTLDGHILVHTCCLSYGTQNKKRVKALTAIACNSRRICGGFATRLPETLEKTPTAQLNNAEMQFKKFLLNTLPLGGIARYAWILTSRRSYTLLRRWFNGHIFFPKNEREFEIQTTTYVKLRQQSKPLANELAKWAWRETRNNRTIEQEFDSEFAEKFRLYLKDAIRAVTTTSKSQV